MIPAGHEGAGVRPRSDRRGDAAAPDIDSHPPDALERHQVAPDVDHWIEVLDVFEANLILAEQQLRAGAAQRPAALEPLVPPSGQVPVELVGRAGDLLTRSVEIESAITRKMERNQEHQAVRWPRKRTRRRPIDLARLRGGAAAAGR